MSSRQRFHFCVRSSGHIVGVSSMLSLTAIPLLGLYCSSKWAFESLHESLAQEVKAFGIRVTILRPAPMPADFASASSAEAPQRNLGLWQAA